MLNIMRKGSQTFLIYLIFGTIILVFALNFGPGTHGCRNFKHDPDVAAKVNGEVIKVREFAWMLERRLTAEAAEHDHEPPTAQSRLFLKQQVLKQLINEKLLNQEAARRGISINDQELLDYLQQQYQLKDVEPERYVAWIRQHLQMTPKRFEEERRQDLARERLLRLVRSLVPSSEYELKRTYQDEHERLKVQFLKFSPAPELKELPGESVRLALQEPAFKQEALTYYEAHRELYQQPATYQVAYLTLKDPTKLESLKTKLAENPPLTTLQQDPALSWQLNTEFKPLNAFTSEEQTALSALKPGEFTKDFLKSAPGAAILHLVAATEPKSLAFNDVQETVARTLLQNKAAKKAALAQAEHFLTLAKQAALSPRKEVHKGAKKAEESILATLYQRASSKPPHTALFKSGFITQGQIAIPDVGINRAFHNELFNLTPQKPLTSKVYELNDAYWLAELTEREHADMEKFASLKESLALRQNYLQNSLFFEEWLAVLNKQAKIEINQLLFKEPNEHEENAEPTS